MAEQLTRRKQIAPQRHPVLDRAVVVGGFGEAFGWHNVQCLPLRQLFRQPFRNQFRHLVFQAGCAVAAFPFDFFLAGLGLADNPAFVDHSKQLLAHLSCLGLAFDDLAINDALAIGKGTSPVATGYRAGGMVFEFVDDLKGTDPIAPTLRRGSASGGALRRVRGRWSVQGGIPTLERGNDLWNQPNTRAIGCQPPVWGKRHQPITVGAGDGTRPEVICRNCIRV